MNDDAELLRRYLEGSEPAFTAPVARHLGLVYGVARRRTRDDSLAREVAQLVFTDVARRAAALARRPSIAGWLYAAANHTAANLLRAEARRSRREQTANAMELNETDSAGPWEQMREVLDPALQDLSAGDRAVVLERYFADASLADIAARRRISENAARMRLERALERLRCGLERRGVSSTAAALATALAGPAVATPAGLVDAIAAHAICAAATAPAAGVLGFLAVKKITATVIGLLIVGAVIPPVVEWRTSRRLRGELVRLADPAVAARPTAFGTTRPTSPTTTARLAADTHAAAELKQLQARIDVLKARPPGVVDAAMRPPANAGTGTPEATFETCNWAINQGDAELFSQLFELEGDTRTSADAFFARLPDSVRQRYGTPKNLIATAWVKGTRPTGALWADSMQVLESTPQAPGVRRVKIWQRTGTGIELANLAEFERRPHGWLLSAGGTAKAVTHILSRLDPTTGEMMPLPPRSP